MKSYVGYLIFRYLEISFEERFHFFADVFLYTKYERTACRIGNSATYHSIQFFLNKYYYNNIMSTILLQIECRHFKENMKIGTRNISWEKSQRKSYLHMFTYSRYSNFHLVLLISRLRARRMSLWSRCNLYIWFIVISTLNVARKDLSKKRFATI